MLNTYFLNLVKNNTCTIHRQSVKIRIITKYFWNKAFWHRMQNALYLWRTNSFQTVDVGGIKMKYSRDAVLVRHAPIIRKLINASFVMRLIWMEIVVKMLTTVIMAWKQLISDAQWERKVIRLVYIQSMNIDTFFRMFSLLRSLDDTKCSHLRKVT